MEITTSWQTIDVDGNSMNGYLAVPADGKKYPAVLVFMEIFGINEHIQDVTERIAKEGYVALAIDFYHRVAPGIDLGYTAEDVEQGKKYKEQTSLANMLEDAEAAITFLKDQPQVESIERLGSIGFCFGGYVAYTVATLPQIAVTASFYGSGIAQETPGKEEPPVDRSDEIRGTMLCFFGEEDVSIPQEDIMMIESSLERAKVQHKVSVYPEADHGFFCDKRGSYNPEVAFSAWTDVKEAFATQLKGSRV